LLRRPLTNELYQNPIVRYSLDTSRRNCKDPALDYRKHAVTKKDTRHVDVAIADYNRTLELNPKNATAYYNRGIAKQVSCDIDGAIADYNRALELNPKDRTALLNRSDAKCAKGDIDGSHADSSRALDLNRSQRIPPSKRRCYKRRSHYDCFSVAACVALLKYLCLWASFSKTAKIPIKHERSAHLPRQQSLQR